MIARWTKTFYQSGTVEVPDDLNEEDAQQFVRDHAASQQPTIAQGAETDIDWSETEFYRPADDEHPPCYLDAHDKNGRIVPMSDWFDI